MCAGSCCGRCCWTSVPLLPAPLRQLVRQASGLKVYIYISFIYLRVRDATYFSAAFTTLLLRLLFSTLRVVFSYSSVATRVFVIVFVALSYLFVGIATDLYLYKPIELGSRR